MRIAYSDIRVFRCIRGSDNRCMHRNRGSDGALTELTERAVDAFTGCPPTVNGSGYKVQALPGLESRPAGPCTL